MRKIVSAFLLFISGILHDFVLAVCVAAPILAGLIFRFVVPVIEKLLCENYDSAQILTPYYVIFDLVLALMTPIAFCFAGVLVMLEEFDNGTAKHLLVTPLGKNGYLFSRVGIPALAAILYDVILLLIFSLSEVDFLKIVVFSTSGALTGVFTSFIVVTFANNKMEGMALIKLCGLLIVGIPAAYFLSQPVKYIFAVLPSFWLAKFGMTDNFLFFVPTVILSLLLIFLLYRRFEKKFL